MKELMAKKPLGYGIGLSKAGNFDSREQMPYPPDSWLVSVWVETGIVGLILYLSIHGILFAWCSWILMFKVRNKGLRVENRQRMKELMAKKPLGYGIGLSKAGNFDSREQMRSTLPDAIGGVLWFGLDDANMTVFTPVYCNTDKVPYPYQQENGDCVTFSWDSAFWIYNWVAYMIRPRYNLMVEDMRTVQNTLEDTYAQSQEGIESAALKLYQQNPAKAKEYLTNYTHMTAQTAVDSWKKLGEFLIVRYNDGAVKRMQNGQLQRPKTGNTAPLDRPGYSKEFLQELVKATGERYKMKELK
jgi:hypothetical protein